MADNTESAKDKRAALQLLAEIEGAAWQGGIGLGVSIVRQKITGVREIIKRLAGAAELIAPASLYIERELAGMQDPELRAQLGETYCAGIELRLRDLQGLLTPAIAPAFEFNRVSPLPPTFEQDEIDLRGARSLPEETISKAFEMPRAAVGGCSKRCYGAKDCATGWPDGSCGARPQGAARPPSLSDLPPARPAFDFEDSGANLRAIRDELDRAGRNVNIAEALDDTRRIANNCLNSIGFLLNALNAGTVTSGQIAAVREGVIWLRAYFNKPEGASLDGVAVGTHAASLFNEVHATIKALAQLTYTHDERPEEALAKLEELRRMMARYATELDKALDKPTEGRDFLADALDLLRDARAVITVLKEAPGAAYEATGAPSLLRRITELIDGGLREVVEGTGEGAKPCVEVEEFVDPDKLRGFYPKWEVKRRVDPEGKHKDCRVLVLDFEHDKFALPALVEYARQARKGGYVRLAEDLEGELDELSGGLPHSSEWALDHIPGALLEELEGELRAVAEYVRAEDFNLEDCLERVRLLRGCFEVINRNTPPYDELADRDAPAKIIGDRVDAPAPSLPFELDKRLELAKGQLGQVREYAAQLPTGLQEGGLNSIAGVVGGIVESLAEDLRHTQIRERRYEERIEAILVFAWYRLQNAKYVPTDLPTLLRYVLRLASGQVKPATPPTQEEIGAAITEAEPKPGSYAVADPTTLDNALRLIERMQSYTEGEDAPTPYGLDGLRGDFAALRNYVKDREETYGELIERARGYAERLEHVTAYLFRSIHKRSAKAKGKLTYALTLANGSNRLVNPPTGAELAGAAKVTDISQAYTLPEINGDGIRGAFTSLFALFDTLGGRFTTVKGDKTPAQLLQAIESYMRALEYNVARFTADPYELDKLKEEARGLRAELSSALEQLSSAVATIDGEEERTRTAVQEAIELQARAHPGTRYAGYKVWNFPVYIVGGDASQTRVDFSPEEYKRREDARIREILDPRAYPEGRRYDKAGCPPYSHVHALDGRIVPFTGLKVEGTLHAGGKPPEIPEDVAVRVRAVADALNADKVPGLITALRYIATLEEYAAPAWVAPHNRAELRRALDYLRAYTRARFDDTEKLRGDLSIARGMAEQGERYYNELLDGYTSLVDEHRELNERMLRINELTERKVAGLDADKALAESALFLLVGSNKRLRACVRAHTDAFRMFGRAGNLFREGRLTEWRTDYVDKSEAEQAAALLGEIVAIAETAAHTGEEEIALADTIAPATYIRPKDEADGGKRVDKPEA